MTDTLPPPPPEESKANKTHHRYWLWACVFSIVVGLGVTLWQYGKAVLPMLGAASDTTITASIENDPAPFPAHTPIETSPEPKTEIPTTLVAPPAYTSTTPTEYSSPPETLVAPISSTPVLEQSVPMSVTESMTPVTPPKRDLLPIDACILFSDKAINHLDDGNISVSLQKLIKGCVERYMPEMSASIQQATSNWQMGGMIGWQVLGLKLQTILDKALTDPAPVYSDDAGKAGWEKVVESLVTIRKLDNNDQPLSTTGDAVVDALAEGDASCQQHRFEQCLDQVKLARDTAQKQNNIPLAEDLDTWLELSERTLSLQTVLMSVDSRLLAQLATELEQP
jgi:hypothetical protein